MRRRVERASSSSSSTFAAWCTHGVRPPPLCLSQHTHTHIHTHPYLSRRAGGIFEYSVDNASAADVPSLERRAAKLERAVVARAEELRRAALKSDFEPPPREW